jgi:hypothetical protein
VGELPRHERHELARAHGARGREVVENGASLRAPGARASFDGGPANRAGLGSRGRKPYDFSTLEKSATRARA